VDGFLVNHGEKLNAVYRDKFGISLKMMESYFPMSRDANNVSDAKDDFDKLLGKSRPQASLFLSHLKEANDNSTALPLVMDANAAVTNYVRQTDKFMAYSDALEQVNGILKDKSIKKIIEGKIGNEAYKSMILNLERHIRGSIGEQSKMVQKLTKSFAGVTLAGNISLLPKQALSAIQYSQDIPISEYLKASKDLIASGSYFATMKEIMNTKEGKARFSGMESIEMSQALYQPEGVGSEVFSTMDKLSTLPARYGDKFATLVGGAPLYEYYKQKYGAEVAAKKWYKSTSVRQQSGSLSNRSKVDDKSAAKLLNQFKSF